MYLQLLSALQTFTESFRSLFNRPAQSLLCWFTLIALTSSFIAAKGEKALKPHCALPSQRRDGEHSAALTAIKKDIFHQEPKEREYLTFIILQIAKYISYCSNSNKNA